MNSVVIGSGFGGIAAALRLKSKNHKVTLIEKHNDLGGRARVFKKNGFTFDAGPTVITAPYLIEELFKLFNKNPNDYIKLKSLDTWYRFVFEDKTTFDYSGDEVKMKEQILKINKSDFDGYQKLLSFTKKIFDKGFSELSDVPFDRPFFMLKQIPSLLKLKSYSSVYNLVSKFISNENYKNQIIFDGYPRTLTQAKNLDILLKKYQQKIDIVLKLNVSLETIKKRISDRKSIEKRVDDNEEIAIKRFQTYEKSSEAVLNYYNQTKLLQVVNGENSISQINNEISGLIDSIKG